jgi:hypothetical protein
MSLPGPYDLLLRVGQSSPGAFLWRFMGASPLYERFAGAIEVLGGLLLLPRRTALLGALVAAGAMSNVVMLNVSYDVCVKLHSMDMLLIAVFLILPDFPRLAAFFLGRAVAAVEPVPARGPRWWRAAWLPLKVLAAGAYILWVQFPVQRRDPVVISAG